MSESRYGMVTMPVMILLLVIVTYVATYLALVDHSGRLVMRDGLCYPQQYRYGERVAKYLFRPARWVDLQVRHCLDDDK